jgi:ElaB/YqjD/DUF883 family membrane-anchored ribosome-binding protein
MTKSSLESASAEALRTIDEVRSLLEGATHDDLAERAAAVKEKLEASRQTLEGAAREASRPLGQALLGAERSLREELEEVEQRIRDNPLGALLAAAGLGVLLGLVISRNR